MPSESAKKRQAQKKEKERQRQQQASAREKQQQQQQRQQKADQVNGDGGVNGDGAEPVGAAVASGADEVKSKAVDKKMASRSCTGDRHCVNGVV